MGRQHFPVSTRKGLILLVTVALVLAGGLWGFAVRYRAEPAAAGDSGAEVAEGTPPPGEVPPRSTTPENPPSAGTGTQPPPDAQHPPGSNVQQSGPQAPALPPQELVTYTGPVEHIFFHPLVVFPELAFDVDYMAQGFNDWFVTVREFERVLELLYRGGYILVDIRDLFELKAENGKQVLTRKELQLPPGKKPMVLSIDDLNYYDYMRANGTAYKLVLDEQGRIATFSVTPKGEALVSRANEIIPLLDAFVEKHPDFSYRGAKGVIALTGYEGILGYRTNDTAAPNYEQERTEALRVVKRLKETGWSFASHGWGHLDAAKIQYATFVADTERWKREVEPLIGPTPVYIYPFGSSVQPGDPKFQYLLNQGFRVLCSVGPKPYLKQADQYMLMDRRHIDGLAFQKQRHLLLDLFDANEVIESEVRPPQKPR